jgi:hypothetical protein
VESNWRLNVWRFFGPDTQYKFMTRIRTGIGAGLYAVLDPGPPRQLLIRAVVPGQLPTLTIYGPFAVVRPWYDGLDVDPD